MKTTFITTTSRMSLSTNNDKSEVTEKSLRFYESVGRGKFQRFLCVTSD